MVEEKFKGRDFVVPGGVYRHFKGNFYKVLEVAKHSENGLPMVVYQALYGEYGLWVRPLEMFLEDIERDGLRVRRFVLWEDGSDESFGNYGTDGSSGITSAAGMAGVEKPVEATLDQDPCIRMLRDPSEALEPAPDLHQLILELDGQRRFGVMFSAGGAGDTKPTLLLLHGFPGNERNFDLAHAVRRLGWNVMIFHYRGTWGSDGEFTFENALEDIRAALAYLRSEAAIQAFGVDPANLFIGGNSFGGFAAILAAQEDPEIKGCIALSVYDLGRMGRLIQEDAVAEGEMKSMFSACVIPTIGGSVEALTQEVLDHQRDWDISGKAELLKNRPVLLVAGSRDVDGPPAVHFEPLKSALEASGVLLEAHLLDSDHGFQNKRIEVSCRMGRFLERWKNA